MIDHSSQTPTICCVSCSTSEGYHGAFVSTHGPTAGVRFPLVAVTVLAAALIGAGPARAIVGGERVTYPGAAALIRPDDGSPVTTRVYCSGALIKPDTHRCRGSATLPGLVALHGHASVTDTSPHPRHQLDEVIHAPVRLSILVALAAADELDFRFLRDGRPWLITCCTLRHHRRLCAPRQPQMGGARRRDGG